MEVLQLLVQRQGLVVTREQLVEKIWGKDVYLDTDNSINGAIRKVRQVLKDDPQEPRFIQTISGKGYRFIAPVTAPIIAPVSSPDTEPAVVAERPQSPAREDFAAKFSRRSVLGISILATAIVLIAAWGAYVRWFEFQTRTLQPGGRAMLAVLPFENLTGDAGEEYFSDGMTEEMITQLGSSDPQHMGVIARTSVMYYKHSQKQLQQIARELGVQYVLEGSVRRDADKVRITAQLIQMRDQTHLWAREYDRDTKNLLVTQSEIAREISGEIRAALGEREPIAPTLHPALSPQAFEAYNLYLKGQYFWNKRTVEGFQQAIGYFRQATEKDPNDARAYAGLAASYALIGAYSGSPAAEFAVQARSAATRALELDDNLPEAHAALALIVQNHDYDWQTSEKEFKRAIELNPNYATGHHWYAEHLAWLGRFDEALRESERARQLDPLSLIIATDNAAILYYSRQYDRAIAQITSVRELDPEFPRASIIVTAYVQKGMFAEAQADVEKHMHEEAPWRWSHLAYTYGRAGQPEKAAHELRKLLDSNRRQPIDPMVIVPAYIGMGNNDQALAWLEKAQAQHSNGLTALRVDPTYDPLRGDPRFQHLMLQVGFAD
ncbi:MAG: winged helix-turn-helix domain-containing protein [Terracidiphilus sp.]|jgi:TolB-like protein/DNA-binding winged helix-turn-helix (wHTH) protein/Tfp pilus assembly protein PilF